MRARPGRHLRLESASVDRGDAAALYRGWLDARERGHGLPGPLYTAPEAFVLDLEAVFRRQWFYAATVCDVREPGDFYVVNVGTDSIVIVREEDGGVQAFHNVCRHRGSRICNEVRGGVANIVCPYHQWTYGLDGRLLHAPSMGASFDPSPYRLAPVQCRVIGGLIFLCLSDEPPASIERATQDLMPYLATYRLDKLKIAAEVEIVANANWKLIMENNRECYHCDANHPELLVALHAYGFGYGLPENEGAAAPQDAEFAALIEKRRAAWAAAGLPHDLIEFPDGLWYRTTRLPLVGDASSMTMDGRPACSKLLHAFASPDTSDLSLWTHPNSWHHFMSDHAMTFRVIPLSATQSRVTTKWLVHEDAVEGVDYDVANLTRVWDATNRQDKQLAEWAQAGVASSAFVPGPLSPETEDMVVNFIDWYVKVAREGLAVDGH